MPCVFCGSSVSMTDEHAIPDWARRALGPSGTTMRTYVRTRTHGRVRIMSGLSVKLRKGVCESCNNGWMGRLEDAVSPWLRPAIPTTDLVALADDMQSVTAFWACKTALVVDLALKAASDARLPSRPGLDWLYANGDSQRPPPPGTQVWMARIGDATGLSSWITRTRIVYGDDRDEGYFVTFSIGHLVFQVFGQGFGPDQRAFSGLPLASISTSPSADPFLTQIWPHREKVVVIPGPTRFVAVEDFIEFAEWPNSHRLFQYLDTKDGSVAKVVLRAP